MKILLLASAFIFFAGSAAWLIYGPTSPIAIVPFLMGMGFLWLLMESQQVKK